MSFQLGTLMCTAAVSSAMREPDGLFDAEVRRALGQYINQDWGIVSGADCKANADALEAGDRIFASYSTTKGNIWIITEADRSYTTIMFPSDY